MPARRLTLAAVAAVVLTAACSSPASPASDLDAAADRIGKQPATFSLTANTMTITGTADPATGYWEMTGDGYVVRRIGADLFVRMSGETLGRLPRAAGKWIRTPIPYGGDGILAYQPDFPWTPARSLAGATGLSRTGDRSFRGVLPWDPVPSPGGASEPAPRSPFTADLDGAGRLTRLVVTVRSNSPEALPLTLTYGDFGTPPAVVAPAAGDVIVEPAFKTALLGSPFL